MKYYIIPDSRDGCTQAIAPEPVPLAQVGDHIANWIGQYHRQGYFSNCRQERLPLDRMEFRLVPDVEVPDDLGEPFDFAERQRGDYNYP